MFLMQIEGAFVQGLGFVVLEVLKGGDPARKWISPGCLYTYGPGSYKIPCINDVPFKFSVLLLKGDELNRLREDDGCDPSPAASDAELGHGVRATTRRRGELEFLH
ncbi:hypothetical protein EV1_009219 [Malus domestica]